MLASRNVRDAAHFLPTCGSFFSRMRSTADDDDGEGGDVLRVVASEGTVGTKNKNAATSTATFWMKFFFHRITSCRTCCNHKDNRRSRSCVPFVLLLKRELSSEPDASVGGTDDSCIKGGRVSWFDDLADSDGDNNGDDKNPPMPPL